MTAKSLLSIGKALGKRYLGYLGLMYSAYEFAICMKQKDDRPSYPIITWVRYKKFLQYIIYKALRDL